MREKEAMLYQNKFGPFPIIKRKWAEFYIIIIVSIKNCTSKSCKYDQHRRLRCMVFCLLRNRISCPAEYLHHLPSRNRGRLGTDRHRWRWLRNRQPGFWDGGYCSKNYGQKLKLPDRNIYLLNQVVVLWHVSSWYGTSTDIPIRLWYQKIRCIPVQELYRADWKILAEH